MSKKIAAFIYKHIDNPSSDFIAHIDKWIHSFLIEFKKKFSSIDFLRLDKYIMLTDQVLSMYLQGCLIKKKYNHINMLIQQLTQAADSNFNFSFEASVLKTIGRFIDCVFKEKDDFVKSNWANFIDCLLEFYFHIKDKRELQKFDEEIFGSIKKHIYQHSVSAETKGKVRKFVNRKRGEMIAQKVAALEHLIRKIDDLNYEPEVKKEEGVVDPVNDYIMKKNYTCKFRRSPIEKMREIIKKDREKKKKKEQERKEEKECIGKGKKEEILEENIVKITDDDIKESGDIMLKQKKKNIPIESNDEEDNELLEDDDDNEEEEIEEEDGNLMIYAQEGEEEEEEEDEDDDLVDDEDKDEEMEEEEDDDDEEVPELVEEEEDYEEEEGVPAKEDKNLTKAYQNTFKNMQIPSQTNKTKEFLNKKTTRPNSQKHKRETDSNNNTAPLKKVKYALENNITSIYDHKKPILLQSQKKSVFPLEASAKKSLLKLKK